MTKATPLKYKPIIFALILGLAVGIGSTVAFINLSSKTSTASRQEEVRKVGATIMPFDLDRTTHIFTDSLTGVVEEVRVKDPSDKAQIDLVRGHLREEANKFSLGDFSDPEAIHGTGMPGLATVKLNVSKIQFDYKDLPDGGKITYTSTDQSVIEALHLWFQAQLSDHGHDVMHDI